MISISMTTSDQNGSVIIPNGDSDLTSFTSRVARQATLDGGCVIIHSGVSDSDRTFRISTVINESHKTAIDYINRNSSLIIISCSEGLFLGTISSLSFAGPKLSMTILIKSKEA